MTDETVRLTMAQALVRYLCNQHTIVDDTQVPLFPGVFAIFGHGNVTPAFKPMVASRPMP